jgi:hypothetical protein
MLSDSTCRAEGTASSVVLFILVVPTTMDRKMRGEDSIGDACSAAGANGRRILLLVPNNAIK